MDDHGRRHLRLARTPPPAWPLPATTERRRSRQLWGLGVDAHVHLMRGMTEMLLALDYADADDLEALQTLTDVQLSLEMSVSSLQKLLGDLFELQRRLLAEQPPQE